MTNMSNKSLFWTLVALNALDVLLTWLIIGLGGYEANPYIVAFMNQFGTVPGMILAKSPPIITIGLIMYYFWDKISPSFRKFTRGILIAFNIGFGILLVYQLGLYTLLKMT